MAECLEAFEALQKAGTIGGFEQETLGPPTLPGWPFYRAGDL